MNPSPEQLKHDILLYARSLGFAKVGVTSAAPLDEAEAFLASWIEQGRAGQMDYMTEEPHRRSRPAELLPGAQSVVALAMSYYNPYLPNQSDAEGRIARYAWGKDYHKVIRKRLESLTRYMQALAPGIQCKTFVDTGPLLERAVAQRAGIGFVGKNTMVITRGLGSWVFLAHVLTTLELPIDGPDQRSCGSCTLCIDACPTQAITAPYQLDARRCISYLTIELKEGTTEALRPKTGEWLFGCDICQDVCPHNTRIPQTALADFQATPPVFTLAEIVSLRNEMAFKERFGGTPLARAGRQGLIRNACLAAAHLQRIDLLPHLKELSQNDPHPLVREHARWAVEQLDGLVEVGV